MKSSGKVFKYGDNIDTDIIIPARHLNMTDIKELSVYCMEPLDPEFYKKCEAGDIMVAGKNFGCGSSREHAPLVIKECGVGCVIANSYARIFYRNAINIGLPIVECDEAVEKIDDNDQVEVDFIAGEIANKTKNEVYKFSAFPEFMQDIMKAGGLVNQTREKLAK